MSISPKAIWQYKCPKCRKKDSYMFKRPFNFRKPLDMHDKCDICGQDFEPEPGFYYGAMFISYLLSTFILLPLALILVFYFGWTDMQMMVFVVILGALIFFRILRLSRAIWLHVMVKYDPITPREYTFKGRDD